MPLIISDPNARSGTDELREAVGSGLWALSATELGANAVGTVLKHTVGTAFDVVAHPWTRKNIGQAYDAVSANLKAGKPAFAGVGIPSKAPAAIRYPFKAARLMSNTALAGAPAIARGARDVAGGAVAGTWKAGSWLYRHPLTMGAGALAVGIGLASATPYDEPAKEEQYASPNMVEAAGGTSDQGTSALLQSMNASGNIVLGLNNQRRG